MNPYPIGIPGTPWGEAERAAWRELQRRQRSYQAEVLTAIERLGSRFEVQPYGELNVGDELFPLMAIRNRDWRDELPVVLACTVMKPAACMGRCSLWSSMASVTPAG